MALRKLTRRIGKVSRKPRGRRYQELRREALGDCEGKAEPEDTLQFCTCSMVMRKPGRSLPCFLWTVGLHRFPKGEFKVFPGGGEATRTLPWLPPGRLALPVSCACCFVFPAPGFPFLSQSGRKPGNSERYSTRRPV